MDAEAAQRLWDDTYAEAGRKRDGATAGGRVRRITLLGGLVLPVWDAVQAALEQQTRASDRKLSVLRLQTTGASSNDASFPPPQFLQCAVPTCLCRPVVSCQALLRYAAGHGCDV